MVCARGIRCRVHHSDLRRLRPTQQWFCPKLERCTARDPMRGQAYHWGRFAGIVCPSGRVVRGENTRCRVLSPRRGSDGRRQRKTLMDECEQRLTLGAYEIVRELEPCAISRRWFAVHARHQTSHVLYELSACRDRSVERRFVAAVQSLAELDHAHILRVESLTFSRNEPWLVTPYTGNQEGLVTLSTLARAKGGLMSGAEAARALVQLLAALQYAQENNHSHGPISMDEVLVDRRGSVSIELFGLRRALSGLGAGNAELRTDEVRSLVEMGYQLVTGRAAEEPRIAACKLVRSLDRRWDDWFETGLDPLGGFQSAAEALEAFPTRSAPAEGRVRVGAVKVVIRRVRSVLRQGS